MENLGESRNTRPVLPGRDEGGSSFKHANLIPGGMHPKELWRNQFHSTIHDISGFTTQQ